MTRTSRRSLHDRYRGPIVAMALAGSLATWPGTLEPVAKAYFWFCVRELHSSALLMRLSPSLVAAVLAGAASMALVTALLLVRHIVGQRRLEQHAAARRRPVDDRWAALAAELGIGGRLTITSDPEVYAFCAGLVGPRVYISAGLLRLLTASEVEAVLRHEARHLQRRDPLRLFAAGVVCALANPFPVLSTLIDRARIRAELAADRAALEAVPLDVLASALLKAARADRVIEQNAIVVGLTSTAARIDALLGRPVTLPFNWYDLVVTGVVLATVIGALAHLALLPLPITPACPACAPL